MTTDITCHPDVPLSQVNWGLSRKGAAAPSLGLYALVGAFTALAFWSSIPLTLRLLFTFRRYGGLYFWSILATTWALNIRAIGWLLRFVVPSAPSMLGTTIFQLGWIGMVTGFSLVLYSRLSILVQSRRVLRLVLAMIIIDGVCLHTSTLILVYGSSIQGPGPRKQQWLAGSHVMDRLHAVWFTLQELIIVGLYMKAAWDHLLKEPLFTKRKSRNPYILLIVVQLVVLIIDLVVVVLACAGYFTLKAMIMSFTYAIKLELEFTVLNQLVAISKPSVTSLATIEEDSERGQSEEVISGKSFPVAACCT